MRSWEWDTAALCTLSVSTALPVPMLPLRQCQSVQRVERLYAIIWNFLMMRLKNVCNVLDAQMDVELLITATPVMINYVKSVKPGMIATSAVTLPPCRSKHLSVCVGQSTSRTPTRARNVTSAVKDVRPQVNTIVMATAGLVTLSFPMYQYVSKSVPQGTRTATVNALVSQI